MWPARLELARRGPDVVLDGGHNPQCMEALGKALRTLYPEAQTPSTTSSTSRLWR